MLAMASKTAATADEMDKLSERTGIGVEELQKWKYAAGQSGADVGKLEVGMKKLSDVMDGASNGSKSNVEAFGKLGISLNDLKTKSQEDIFGDVMKSLADMPKGAERNALGNDLLGKSYTEMLPLLNAGGKGMEDLKSRASELGLVMSEKAIKANVVFGDTMDDVQNSLGAVTMGVSTAFLPIVQSLLDWVLSHMPQIQSVFQSVFGFVGDSVKTLGIIITDTLIPAFKNTYDNIKSAIDWVIQFQQILIPLGVGILAGALVFGIYTLAIKAHTLATTIVTGATTAFGTVMAFITSPIGIVVLAIGALIAIFVLAYNNIEGFRNIIDGAWSFIQTKTKEIFENYIMPFIKDQLMPLFQKVFSTIGDVVKGAFTLIGLAWDNVLKPIFNLLIEFIQNILVPAWKKAFNIVGGAVKEIFNTIGDLWNNSLKPIFNGILDFISGVFTGNWKKAWNGVVSVFKGIWEGMKAIAKAPINFIIGGLNGFIDGINEIQIPDWVPGLGGMGFSIPNIPSFAVGTRYLPGDMLIQAHKGEMIVPADENPYANSDGAILGNNNIKKSQTVIQLVLQNGKAIAEFIVDDLDNLMGNKNKIVGRSVGI